MITISFQPSITMSSRKWANNIRTQIYIIFYTKFLTYLLNLITCFLPSSVQFRILDVTFNLAPSADYHEDHLLLPYIIALIAAVTGRRRKGKVRFRDIVFYPGVTGI